MKPMRKRTKIFPNYRQEKDANFVVRPTLPGDSRIQKPVEDVVVLDPLPSNIEAEESSSSKIIQSESVREPAVAVEAIAQGSLTDQLVQAGNPEENILEVPKPKRKRSKTVRQAANKDSIG